MNNPWFTGRAEITTYNLEELLGTKLRALFQRKKGRDLLDLWNAMSAGGVNPEDVIDCFLRYMENAQHSITRARFEANLAAKMEDRVFLEDVHPLLPPDHSYDPREAAELVRDQLLCRLPGAP